MAKFKVGDKVRIIKSNNSYMMAQIGQIMTIEKVFDGQVENYFLEEHGTV